MNDLYLLGGSVLLSGIVWGVAILHYKKCGEKPNNKVIIIPLMISLIALVVGIAVSFIQSKTRVLVYISPIVFLPSCLSDFLIRRCANRK